MRGTWGILTLVIGISLAASAEETQPTIAAPSKAAQKPQSQVLPKMDCTVTVGGECQTPLGSIEVKQGPTPRLNQAQKDIEELKKRVDERGVDTIERVTEREVVERMPIAVGVDTLVPFNSAYWGAAARLNFTALTIGKFEFGLHGSVGAVHFRYADDNPLYLSGGVLGGRKLGPGNLMLGLNAGGTNRMPGMEHFEYGPMAGYDYQFKPGWSVSAFFLPHVYKPFYNQDGQWQGRATIGFTYQPESQTLSEKTVDQIQPSKSNDSVKGKVAKK